MIPKLVEIYSERFREDIEAVKHAYPYIVVRRSLNHIELDIGSWVCENVGDNMLVISKKAESTAPWSSVLVAYGFKFESDATAFKLRFGT